MVIRELQARFAGVTALSAIIDSIVIDLSQNSFLKCICFFFQILCTLS